MKRWRLVVASKASPSVACTRWIGAPRPDAVLAGLVAEGYPLAKDWSLDLIEAIHTAKVEALKSNTPVWKRNRVSAAILLAHSVTADRSHPIKRLALDSHATA